MDRPPPTSHNRYGSFGGRTQVAPAIADVDGYFWIHDLNQVMVMHPIKPALNGKDLTDLEDKAGDKLFIGMNKVISENADAGFYSYFWGKPGADKTASFSQESCVRLFKPWGYVVEVVDIDAVLPVVLGVLSYFISRSIGRPLARIRGDMLALADGKTDIDIDDAKIPSDLKAMAATVVVFRDNAVERESLRDP